MEPPSQIGLYDPSYASVTLRGNPTSVTTGGATRTVSSMDYTGLPVSWTGPEGTSVRNTTPLLSKGGLPSSMVVDGVPLSVTFDGMQRLSTATGATGDTTTFGWDLEDRPVSRKRLMNRPSLARGGAA